MAFESPYLWSYVLPAFDFVIQFAETHLQLISALGIGLGGWLAIRRWQAEQALKSWNSQMSHVFQSLDKNLSLYHECYLLMQQAHAAMMNADVDGKQKKQQLEQIANQLPDEMPQVMISSDDLQLFYSIGIQDLFEKFQDCLVGSRFNAMAYKVLICDLVTLPEEKLAGAKPKTKAIDGMFHDARKTGLQLNKIQLLLAAMNTAYQDWLVETKFMGGVNFKAFRASTTWKSIVDEYYEDATHDDKPSETKDAMQD